MKKAKNSSAGSAGTVELRVEDLARGGAGVARDGDGRVVFIPATMPGDHVLARIVRREKRFAEAELAGILTPSPDRVAPRCPAFGRCGGCDWQHVPYPLQWKAKVRGVREALEKAAIEPPRLDEIPAEKIWNYRNRVRFHGQGGAIGFRARRSRELVAIDRCDIADPAINARLESVRRTGAAQKDPYTVEIEVLPGGGIREAWHLRQGELGFRQVHDEQNAKLRAWIAAQVKPGRELLDLYGGDGNLSLGLADSMKRIDCVDVSAPARPAPGTPANVRFHREATADWLRKASASKAKPPKEGRSAILDPPRAGIGEDFATVSVAVAALGVDELVHVGCDVDAWVRDLSRWIRAGWRLRAAGVLDLFPQTHHVESIAALTLTPKDRSVKMK